MAAAKKTPTKTAPNTDTAPARNEAPIETPKPVETTAKAAPRQAPERVAKTGPANPGKGIEVARKQVAEAVTGFGDLPHLNQQNYQALVAAGDVAAKGFEAWQAEILAFARAQLDDGVAQGKALMQVRTLDQWLELNTGFVKGAVDAYIRESTKLGELAWKSTSEAWAPLNGRVEKTIESYAKRFAA